MAYGFRIWGKKVTFEINKKELYFWNSEIKSIFEALLMFLYPLWEHDATRISAEFVVLNSETYKPPISLKIYLSDVNSYKIKALRTHDRIRF